MVVRCDSAKKSHKDCFQDPVVTVYGLTRKIPEGFKHTESKDALLVGKWPKNNKRWRKNNKRVPDARDITYEHTVGVLFHALHFGRNQEVIIPYYIKQREYSIMKDGNRLLNPVEAILRYNDEMDKAKGTSPRMLMVSETISKDPTLDSIIQDALDSSGMIVIELESGTDLEHPINKKKRKSNF